jgi:HD-GYP domain-containing protein (c-di-GMP phosphodiesterase class II)
VVLHHHERYDGTGYPERLSGDDIPLAARVFAVADVLDALLSSRPYHSPLSFEEAKEVVARGRGTHFDPAIVDLLEGIHRAEFDELSREIAERGVHNTVNAAVESLLFRLNDSCPELTRVT